MITSLRTFLILGLCVGLLFVTQEGEAKADTPGAFPTQTGFPATLNGSKTEAAAVAIGDVNGDGINDIVVGAFDGKVHVYTGAGVRLWEYDTGDMAISGKPAIADIDGDGQAEVVVTAGSTLTPGASGILVVLDHTGRPQCRFAPQDTIADGRPDGIFASPTVADLDGDDGGRLEIIFPAWDFYLRVLNDDCSVVWEKFMRDTLWSSPAIGDLDRDGFLDIVMGIDTHTEPAFDTLKGGQIVALDRMGNSLPGFPQQIDEVIFSSPALGDVDGDGYLEIAVGTGDYWGNPACGHPEGCTPGVGRYVNLWNHDGTIPPGWPRPTGSYVFASPALADIDNDNLPEIIVNSHDAKIYAWNADGSAVPGWPVEPVLPFVDTRFATTASPIVADGDGDGSLEVFLPSNWDIFAWSASGAQLTYQTTSRLWDFNTPWTVGGTPAIGDVDGDGDVELVTGGAQSGGNVGAIYAWDLAGRSDGVAWGSFRHDLWNNGALPAAPILIGLSRNEVTLLFVGEDGTATQSIFVEVGGSGTISWSASAEQPNRVRVSSPQPDGVGRVRFDLTVDSTGLAPGSHDLGAVTITASQNGAPLDGSPAMVTMAALVLDSGGIYLPYINQ